MGIAGYVFHSPHMWKHAECDHVTKKKGAKKSSEAESFKHMKIKYPHLKMAM
jgi:hypothetical protein